MYYVDVSADYRECLICICYLQGASLDIQFNVDKSYLFTVGKSYGEILPALTSKNEQRCKYRLY